MGDVVIDSSALIAILYREKEADDIKNAIKNYENICISAATYAETSIVLDSQKNQPHKNHGLDDFINEINVQIIPFDKAQAIEARLAYRRFGKGNHPAQLNMGDCFSYALAKHKGAPLLYKGNDFSHTDIISALS